MVEASTLVTLQVFRCSGVVYAETWASLDLSRSNLMELPACKSTEQEADLSCLEGRGLSFLLHNEQMVGARVDGTPSNSSPSSCPDI